MRNPLRVILVFVCVFVVTMTGCASLDEWERNAIFQIGAAASRFPLDSVPAEIEAFDLHHPNGDTVHAWYMPAGRPDAPTALFLHGARPNVVGRVSHIEPWHARGFNVLATD